MKAEGNVRRHDYANAFESLAAAQCDAGCHVALADLNYSVLTILHK